MQSGFLNRRVATHVEMTRLGFNKPIYASSVISNRTKWVWEISIYVFSITPACSLDFSIVASQLMSKWLGGRNIQIHPTSVISNRTKWVWEISIYVFSLTLAFSPDFSIVASQLMSKWPGWDLISVYKLHLSFRTEQRECEKSQFMCFQSHWHAVRISQSLLGNSCRNDLVEF